jgi:hypothetical protein
MLHPFMTAELVRQRRAALDAESRTQRLVRQRPPRARADPERGRFALTAQTFARHVRALLAHDDSGRREALEEYAALHDFLAEKFPLLKEEWLARRASFRGTDSKEVPET